MKGVVVSSLLALLALGVACGKSTNIGKTGGTVSSAEGAKVAIPAGAVDKNATISIQKLATTPTLPASATALGAAFSFTSSSTFALPVTITLPLDPTKVPAGTGVVILSQADGSTTWTALPGGTVSGHTVSAPSSGFSIKIPVALAATCTTPAPNIGPSSGGTSGSVGAPTPGRGDGDVGYACVCGGLPVTTGNAPEPTTTGAMSGGGTSGSVGTPGRGDGHDYDCPDGHPNTGPSGSSGASGSSGTTVPSGDTGPSGTSGTSGVSGDSGASGTTGTSGTSGTSGSSGSSGTSGTCTPTFTNNPNTPSGPVCSLTYADCNKAITCSGPSTTNCTCTHGTTTIGTPFAEPSACSADGLLSAAANACPTF